MMWQVNQDLDLYIRLFCTFNPIIKYYAGWWGINNISMKAQKWTQ